MSENIVVGFDCGASHSSLSIWHNGQKISTDSTLPGLNLDAINSDLASKEILPFLKKLSPYSSATWIIGMAGLDSDAEINEANLWFKNLFSLAGLTPAKYTLLSDIDLVLWAGSANGSGIGLIAGTGSNCKGRNSYGETFKVGGLSHLLSDEGSGFSLGWQCLHLITKMSDGRAEKTPLLNEVLQLYGCANLVELKNLLIKSSNQKASIAKSAELLLTASDRGEEDAMKICADQSLELVRLVASVDSHLRSEELLPVFLAGSLFRNQNYLDLFKSGLQRFSPNQKVSLVSPLDGVLPFSLSLPQQ